MNKILMVLILLMMVCVSDVYAQDDDIESLRGLKGVDIIIEVLNPDIEEDGLRREQIETDVELKLRLAGIKVLTREERLKEPGMPFLYVRITSLKREAGLSYGFSVEVSLSQYVYLKRNPKIIINADTWSVETLGNVGIKKIDFIRDSVKDLVDIFVNDYLTVNPK